MPTLNPLAVLPWVDQQWCDADGAPLIGGSLEFFIVGTSTPAAVFSDADGINAMTNPVILDGSGRPEAGMIYLSSAHGYKVIVRDVNDVELYTRDSFEDIGAVFAANLGIVLSEGSKAVVSGYQILVSDRLITVDSTGGPDPCVITLLPVADATQPITVKNSGTVIVNITVSGVDAIDFNGSFFALPAATAFNMPTITLVPYPPSDWFITASYGL